MSKRKTINSGLDVSGEIGEMLARQKHALIAVAELGGDVGTCHALLELVGFAASCIVVVSRLDERLSVIEKATRNA